MEKKIVFASHNENKVSEIREMLSPLGYEVLSLKDLGLVIDAEELSPSFEGNSRIKALDIAFKTSYPVIADDSGLAVDALNGFPGVRSARFMEGKSYQEKCEALISMLKDYENKDASFFTAIIYLDKKYGIDKCFMGQCQGRIMPSWDDGAPDKFGYDPVFYSYDLKKTFGRASSEEKNSVSHRGRAMKQLIDFLSGIGK
ncbi:MAG: RdgB/HAM1 family non-canonical purine NTP pyrophosphatase [Bacilli bacterium]